MLKIAHCRDCSLADFVQGAVNVATAKVKVETQNRREIKRPNTSKALSDSSLEYLICSSQSLQTGLEVCHSFVTSHGKEIAAKKNKVDRNQNNTFSSGCQRCCCVYYTAQHCFHCFIFLYGLYLSVRALPVLNTRHCFHCCIFL